MRIGISSPPVAVEYVRDVPYGEAGGRTLLLDIARPVEPVAEPFPAVVQIHGGGWIKGGREPEANRVLVGHGFFTVSIDYRLAPRHTFPAQLHDCKAAVRWLRARAAEYRIDPDRIGVWGGSAGGHLAALLGTTGGEPELEGDSGSPGYSSRVRAVVTICGASDLSQADGYWLHDPDSGPSRLFGGLVGERPELVALASPISHIGPDTPPFLIVHGDRDEVSPVRQSEMLCEALRGAGMGIEFVRAEGERHSFSPGWQSRIEWLRLGFFLDHLQP
jgi:acetyl esterase/lipase